MKNWMATSFCARPRRVREARAGEAPHDHGGRDALDERRETPADERDRAGGMPCQTPTPPSTRHVEEARPRQHDGHAGGALPAGVADRRRRAGGLAIGSSNPSRSCGHRAREHRGEECDARLGQRVHDHLPVTARAHEPGGAQLAHMMRDQLVRALAHPREVADAQLAPVPQCGGDRQAGGSASAFAASAARQLDRRRPLRRSASARGRSRHSRSHVSGEDMRTL